MSYFGDFPVENIDWLIDVPMSNQKMNQVGISFK